MKRVLLHIGAIAMILIGIAHFADPSPFERIVPGVLPAPRALVYVSGFFEVLGGIGLLVPRTRRAAAWGLIALYLCVFPANINMALNEIQLHPGGTLPVWAMWVRLPFQGIFIAWAYWFTKAVR